MGNDGGSIPGRAELVKSKKKEKRVESELVAKFRAKFCALTKERLRKPVAACRIGYIYNYDSLLQAKMDKRIPQEFSHIQKASDMKQLKIQENPDPKNEFPFVCPISGKSLNGKNRFYALWTCGCVFFETIIKDLGIKKFICPLCSAPYQSKDIVELCPTIEEAEYRKAELQIQLKQKKQSELSDKQEPQLKKKVCMDNSTKPLNQLTIPKNKMEKLIEHNNKEIKDSQIYKSLFHTEYKLEDNLFTRNVRYGLR